MVATEAGVRTTAQLVVAAALFARGFPYRGAVLEHRWVHFRFADAGGEFDRAVAEYYAATAPPVQARAVVDALDMLRDEMRACLAAAGEQGGG